MRIVVNHLTRIREGYICVAGIDLETGTHVRPVLERTNLGITLLRKYRGPFDMAAIVDLGTTRYVGKAPELEDYQFVRERAHREEDMQPAEFWGLLQKLAQPDIAA